MIEGLEKIAQLGGTIVTVVIFIWYLSQKDKASNEVYNKFNTTISNHLDHSTKIIEKNSNAYIQIAITLKELCILMKKNNKGMQGMQGVQGVQGKKGGV